MGVKWTEEQQQVIRLRNRNILVSAAAGSGKTAVLVERILTRLTKDIPPLDVDRMLVVTFTEAAAAEMKERIRDAIEAQLLENPENVHLQRQATLIDHAQVTTIHSFCLSVIREHFSDIDLDPGFRIAEEGELKLLKRDVAEALLDERYEENTEEFLRLADTFAPGRNDEKLTRLLLEAYEFAGSYPDPEEWLSHCAGVYEEAGHGSFLSCIQRETRNCTADMKRLLSFAAAVCREADGPDLYEDVILSDLGEIQRIEEAEGYEAAGDAIRQIRWMRLPGKKMPDASEEKKAVVKAVRDTVKGMAADLQGQYYYCTWKEAEEDMRSMYPVIKEFVRLVLDFTEKFSAEKRGKNLIDFRDMEHFALQILAVKKDGQFVPTEAAAEYQEQFEEIMIDEYQDSNLIQETLLTSVSRTAGGIRNIFMVGDVKQSIYRFRLARPELFMEKFDTYDLSESLTQRIDLSRNFRSRREVLESTNFIFRQIMQKKLGGISYDSRAALYTGADYLTMPGNETEVLLLDLDQAGKKKDKTDGTGEADGGQEADSRQEQDTDREREARMIAGKIRELVGSHPVLDKKSGEYRPARYCDIVILLRSLKGWAEPFAAVLKEEGIPAFAGSKEGYFETWEVSTILDYLKVLDNLRQDIPLASVLRSPFAGLSAQELAAVKLKYPEQPFYIAVRRYGEEYPETEVGEKIKSFFVNIKRYREMMTHTAVHELLFRIMKETGYADYVAAMPGGRQRRANLDMLVEKAVAFESTSYKGLYHFVRYIHQLQKYDVDYGEAALVGEQADVVRLMSIHKSKGLEFPIVFVSGTGKQFNTQDTKSMVVLHPELGMGVDAVDLMLRTKMPVLLKKVIQRELTLENLGEELRILYVAMTRAKEKLILTGTVKNLAGKLAALAAIRGQEDPELGFAELTGARSYLDWILPALVRHKSFAPVLESCDLTVPFTNPMFRQEVPIIARVLTDESVSEQSETQRQADRLEKEWLRLSARLPGTSSEQMRDKLKQQFSFRYPYETLIRQKRKYTVTELKRMQYKELDEEYGAGEILYPDAEERTGKSIEADGQTEAGKNEGLTGADRGTAYHRAAELLPFGSGWWADSVQKSGGLKEVVGKPAATGRLLDGFVHDGRMTQEMRDCVKAEDLAVFLCTGTAGRMQAAAERNRLHKEQPFVLGMPMGEVDSLSLPEEQGREMVLVQGIIDVWFEEEDGLVVLDYKTDRVRDSAQLTEKYKSQLDYYAKALEQITGKRVKEKWMYSFFLQKEIEV